MEGGECGKMCLSGPEARGGVKNWREGTQVPKYVVS